MNTAEQETGNESQVANTVFGFVFFVVILVMGYLAYSSVKDNYQEYEIKTEVKESYYTQMKDVCEGFAFSECQVVQVLSQEVELEPLRLTIKAKEDFTDTDYSSVTLTNLKTAPSEDLSRKFVKMNLEQGYVTSLEVVGSEAELEALQDEAVEGATKDK